MKRLESAYREIWWKWCGNQDKQAKIAITQSRNISPSRCRGGWRRGGLADDRLCFRARHELDMPVGEQHIAAVAMVIHGLICDQHARAGSVGQALADIDV